MSVVLEGCPSDYISKVTFSGNTHLLVSSWDKSVTIFNIADKNSNYTCISPSPVLDCTFLMNKVPTLFAYGCLDSTLRYVDANTKKEIILGKHDAPVRCVGSAKNKGTLVSASWDKTIKQWSLGIKNYLISTTILADKAYAMAVSNYNVAVGTADKRIQIYDIRKFDKPFYDKIQTNCSQIRSLCFMKDDESLAVGTTSSRVLIEYITTKKTPYSFICHKKSVEGVSVFYPINTLTVNPKYNTLATGGSDATASIWDIDSQKRVSCLQLVTSISSMCFSEDGYKLAIACSYNRDNGIRENENYHKIIIRNSTENELKLK